MKKILTLNAIIIASVITLFCSCGSKPKGATLIPEDALVVSCINVEETMDAADLSDNAQLKEKMKNGIKQMELSRMFEKQLTDIVDDPSKTGIDFSEPFFIAVLDMDEMLYEFTGSLDDSKKFEELIGGMMKETRNDSALKTATSNPNIKYVDVDGNTFVLFDEDGFIMCNKKFNEDESGFVEFMAKQFSEEKNYTQTKGYDMLMSEDGIAKMHIALGKILSSKSMEMSMNRIPAETKKKLDLFSESDLVMALNVSKGEATYTCIFDPGTDEAKDYYDKMCESTGEIKGTFLKYVDENVLLAASMNFDGKKYVELQKEQINTLLGTLSLQNAGNDIKEIIESMDGDVTMSISGKLLGNKKFPEMNIYSSTENDKLVKYIADINSDGITQNGNEWLIKLTENEYKQVGRNYDWTEKEIGQAVFGYKDKTSYFAISENGTDAFRKADNPIDKGAFKGNKFYMRLNFAPMLKMKEMEYLLGSRAEGEIIRDVLSKINYAEMTVENNYKAEIRIVMNDKEQTPIAVIAEIMKEILM